MEGMTDRQSFAIFCATGVDVRDTQLSKDEASDLISRAKRGIDVRGEVLGLEGAVEKRKPKAKVDYAALIEKAHAAGMAAGEACRPTPMQVVERANPLDDGSPVVRAYAPIMDGLCGFAWVYLRDGRGSFANWLRQHKRQGIVDGERRYEGGTYVTWVHAFGQSYERKMAYADAFAKALRDAGIEGAYAGGRLD